MRVRVLESPQGESEHHVVSREDGPAGQHHLGPPVLVPGDPGDGAVSQEIYSA